MYDKSYRKSEYENRLNIFLENCEFIAQHNLKKNIHYKLEINEFADLTFEEFYKDYASG